MTHSADKLPGVSYDDFYRAGGWTYALADEIAFLHFRIIQPLGLTSGKAIDLGCGTGIHTEALRRLIGRAHGVDTSVVAIDFASQRFPLCRFSAQDALAFMKGDTDPYDLVFARGMSWFHRALERDLCPHPLDELMRVCLRRLNVGGHFVLQIRTDFSGRTETDGGIRHHRVSQLSNWACEYGELRFITDWMGLPLISDANGLASGRNAIVAIQRHA